MEDEFKKNTAEAIGIANEEAATRNHRNSEGLLVQSERGTVPRTPGDRSRRESVGGDAHMYISGTAHFGLPRTCTVYRPERTSREGKAG